MGFMWCDQVLGFIKQHATVPGAVIVFSLTYIFALVFNAGPEWVQALGGIASVVAVISLAVRQSQFEARAETMKSSASRIFIRTIAKQGADVVRGEIGIMNRGGMYEVSPIALGILRQLQSVLAAVDLAAQGDEQVVSSVLALGASTASAIKVLEQGRGYESKLLLPILLKHFEEVEQGSS